jgi:hypothetical protein
MWRREELDLVAENVGILMSFKHTQTQTIKVALQCL